MSNGALLRQLRRAEDAPLMPVFCTQHGLKELIEREADRIAYVTCFSDRYLAARGSAVGRFTLNQLAMPASVVEDDDATYEARLAPRGTTVVHQRWVEPHLGVVEESRFGEQRFVRLTLPEHWHADSARRVHGTGHDRAPLRHAAFSGYSYLFGRQRSEALTAQRYANYVPDMIDLDSRYAAPVEHARVSVSDGLYTVPPGQRYVSFNHGRFDAWRESGPKRLDGTPAPVFQPAGERGWVPVCPATTCIGTKHGDLVIEAWYTASPNVFVHYVENARQTTPFRYNTRYGRRPPVFARGTYIETDTGAGIIISGTASILQSEVVHDTGQLPRGAEETTTTPILEGYFKRQLSQIVENIAFLLSERNLRPQGVRRGFTLEDLTGIRVYLKHAEYAALARAELARLLPDKTPMIVVEGDICRPGWLLEIDGLAWRHGDRSCETR